MNSNDGGASKTQKIERTYLEKCKLVGRIGPIEAKLQID
jgi:hypothetical protein